MVGRAVEHLVLIYFTPVGVPCSIELDDALAALEATVDFRHCKSPSINVVAKYS